MSDKRMHGRLIRMTDDDWRDFKDATKARGETPSKAIRDFVRRYNARWKRKKKTG